MTIDFKYEIPETLDWKPRQVLSPIELSEIYTTDRKFNAIDFAPLPNGRVAVYDHQNGSIVGTWFPDKETYDFIKELSDQQAEQLRRIQDLYNDALYGGEPQSSQLARDLRAARREPVHRPIKPSVELLDL